MTAQPFAWRLDNVADYRFIRDALYRGGYAHEIDWSENIEPCVDADVFAEEIIFVICNSGMKATIARPIYDRVIAALRAGRPAASAFGHAGKVASIQAIFDTRHELFDAYAAADDKHAFLLAIPWIGSITVFHAMKNLGVDCMKPDRHLERIAAHVGEDPHDLCARLARESGDRVATVDLVLWRASELGIIRTRELAPAA